MFRKLIALVLFIGMLSGLKGQEAKKPIFSTTMDFLDYCFYDNADNSDLFALEVFEARLKQCADAGIKKVYLRVNCLGLTLYPTKVALMYGDEGCLHWDSKAQSMRLIKTIHTYDVCQECIRLCHKYGMECWAWESLCDGGGVGYSDIDVCPEEYKEVHRKLNGNPFCDPFYLAHPEGYAMRDPKLMMAPQQIERINQQAVRGSVGRILVVDSVATGKLPRIKPEEVEIYVSDDNQTYTRYTTPFVVKTYVDSGRHSTVEITGLDIPNRYVKLAHPEYRDSNWAIAVRDRHGVCKAFDTKGRELFTTWSNIVREGATKERTGFSFTKFDTAAYDYTFYQTGFMRGMPDESDIRYHKGVYEFNNPLAMEHQLARFAELAAYPFDGYMLNFRTHSYVLHPEEYGYNKEVRDIYLKQHGVDIWKRPADPAKLALIRADGLARYLKGCKVLIGKRPLYITAVPPAPAGTPAKRCGAMGNVPGQLACRGMCVDIFGPIGTLYHRYFAQDQSVDGVIMNNDYFPEYFTPEVTGGRKIAIGLYRERPGDRGAYNESKYDFQEDMRRIYNLGTLDEIELYETLNYTTPHCGIDRLKVLRELTGGRKQ